MRRPWYARRTNAGDVAFSVFNTLFLVLFCLTILYPFWTTLLLSFSPPDEVLSLGFRIWIDEWATTAYRFAFSKYGNVITAYANSVYRTVVGTVLTVLFTTIAAYPLAKKNLPGRTALTVVVLITMFFSGGLIPLYLVVRSLGLIDSRWSLILPALTVGFYIIIMRNFFMTVDTSYEEAAFMDGANYLQILFRIIVPLSKPVMATLALWHAVWHWNEWLYALIFLNDESLLVLQRLLRRMLLELTQVEEALIDQFESVEEVRLPSAALRAAVTIITIGPIILLYPFVQKYFIKGIFIGSLKG